MNAIDLDRYQIVVFSPEPVPEDLHEAIEGYFGGKILTDVELNRPDDPHTWPEGSEPPQSVLCVTESDPEYRPRHFRVFKYDRQVEPGFRRTGKSHIVMGIPSGWRVFIDKLQKLDAIAGETDATDTDEAWDRITRGVATVVVEGFEVVNLTYHKLPVAVPA